ncbi:SOS response-associated peptidase family protein [Cellvibrio fibrivorans]|uniref:SOS response-associated peptidase YedK n=1 Tax=Cellvibrio fibrivorans TaxID=126350 RepID=A0ABU1UTX5_9GAMM|nr:SOS response-associated peptidase family protein [Cellvibrio fibrivorans]MDR7088628.1 putative SOS response-associated peptidase YedK [Cellvibrio fibrivorans]
MCGYVRRHVGPRTLKEFLSLLGMTGYYEDIQDDEPELKHFYPAFGGNANRRIEGLLIQQDGELKLVDATWWYDCQEVNGELEVGPRTTFNARNLASTYWKDAIHRRRGIVIATGIGEGKTIDGKDKHYLVTAERLMFLGAVYREFSGEHYSCAIITRDTHPRFEPYHDKAFPLFLPPNLDFLKLWLSDASDDHPQIVQLLANTRIFSDLSITPVKTFKGGVATGSTEYLKAD